ncbi:ecotin family protein [Campylobacter sp. 19-13652]|uniref:ecotin family protein n=1 Tax=Campylobacter sp. 19-13652 TaxID=2840180 RepID=UPI001C76F948|nr:ecotin family protein [Campylobacter sp. 19-13652]BCX80055.1 hypothetical protein LBC_15170 [Campylobacter sp. 19-13652]
MQGCASAFKTGAKSEKSINLKELFPAQISGKQRQIITLKEIKNEQDYLVIISFGKWLELDCNHYFLGMAEIKEHSLNGYGYAYYEFNAQNGILAGTKMVCLGQKKQNKFIKYSSTLTLPYNHKLPLIFYAPKNVRVEYQIYKRINSGFGYFE